MFGIKKKAGNFDKELQAKMNELDAIINSSASDIRGRIAAAISGGYDYADTLHNIYLDYGYPGTLTFTHFWNMYRRFGIAKNVVDLPVDVGWMVTPTIEAADSFVKEFDRLDNQVSFWQRMKGLDKRQRVGRYAGMFMRVKDGQEPSKPLEGGLSGSAALMGMIPLYEGQLDISTTDQNPKSERYSLPEMYQFNGSGTGDRNEQSGDSFQIHWTRIVTAAEGADNGGVYGIPALESVYNSLMDLRKIAGAGGEGFYRNAAQSTVFNLQDATSAKANEPLLNKFNEQWDDFVRNRMRKAMWTPGMEAKTLESNLITPKEFFMNSLNDVAAGSQIPATILIGQQTGRLASVEDSRGFLGGLNSRNENFTTSMVRDTVDWFIEWGILASAEYEVVWSDLLEMSDEERLGNAFKMADTNAKHFENGGEMVFTAPEIRKQGGFEDMEGVIPMNSKSLSETDLNNAKSVQAISDSIIKFADSIGADNMADFSAFLKDVVGLDDAAVARLLEGKAEVEPMIEDEE